MVREWSDSPHPDKPPSAFDRALELLGFPIGCATMIWIVIGSLVF